MTSPQLGRRRWWILASAVVSFYAVGCTFFAVPPLVPELVRRFGLDHLQLGVLMGSIAAPAIILSIPLGRAVDHWPARLTGVGGLLVMLAGGTLFALAPGYVALLVGRLLFGIGGLVMNLLLARLITTAFAGRELSLAMGIFSAVYPASMISIFSLHPALLAALGWRGELLLLAALAAISLPLHLVAVPRSDSARTPATSAAPTAIEKRGERRNLAALSVAWALFFAAFAPVVTFAPEWIGGGQHALLTVTVVYWIALVLSPLLGAVMDRAGGPKLWAMGGLLLISAALVLMGFELAPPLVAMALVGFAAAAVPTATYALPGRLVAPSAVGAAFGLITAFSNLGTLAGPALAGALRDHTQAWPAAWLSLAAAGLVGAAALATLRTDGKR